MPLKWQLLKNALYCNMKTNTSFKQINLSIFQ